MDFIEFNKDTDKLRAMDDAIERAKGFLEADDFSLFHILSVFDEIPKTNNLKYNRAKLENYILKWEVTRMEKVIEIHDKYGVNFQ